MGHFDRLQLIGRITYYLGWIALLCGGVVQLNLGAKLFLAVSLTKRNLLELSMACFVICIASALRALTLTGDQMSGAVRKAA